MWLFVLLDGVVVVVLDGGDARLPKRTIPLGCILQPDVNARDSILNARVQPNRMSLLPLSMQNIQICN